MDKFWGSLQRNTTNTTNTSQVLVPNDFLRLDGTTSMLGPLNLDSNRVTNVHEIVPRSIGSDIDVDGSFNMKNYFLKNIQGLYGTQGSPLKFHSTIEMGSNIDLNGREIVNPRIPESDNALAAMKTVRDNYGSLEPAFTKETTNMFPVTGQIFSASSLFTSWGSRADPSNAFEIDLTTQWLT